MLAWVIQITLVSLILIFIIHNLINFFKSTLTVPKIKDLVNNPNKKYDDIYTVISSEKSNEKIFNKNNFSYNEEDLLPKNENDMKNELKNFLKKQLKEPVSDISTLSSMPNSSSYSYSDF